MKQVGKIQEWMQDTANRRGMKRDLPTHAVDLALILLTESQKRIKSKEKRLRYMFSGIAHDEGIKEFFQHYQRYLHAGDHQQREELKDVYARNRKNVLSAFGMMDAWRLRLARYSMADELGLIESLLGDSMGALVMRDDADLIEKQEQLLAKSSLHASMRLLTPSSGGEQSIASHRDDLVALFEQLKLASVDIEVCRLLPRVDVYQQDDTVEVFLQRVRPLLDANARREAPLRLIFTGCDDDRLFAVARACCQLREEAIYNKMELGIEIAACLDTARATLDHLEGWAKQQDSHRLTVRLIKGDQLEAQRSRYAHADRGLRLSESKLETDLCLRDLVQRLSQSPHLRLDLGTHQIFDLGYTCAVWKAEQRTDIPDFTLYSGLGDALAQSMATLGGRVYLQSFHYAVGHEAEAELFRVQLINGLGDAFPSLGVSPKVKPQSREWLDMVQHFQLSCNKSAQLRDLHYQPRAMSFTLPVQKADVAQALAGACSSEYAVDIQSYVPTIAEEKLSSRFTILSRSSRDYELVDYRTESLTFEQVDTLVERMEKALDIEPVLATRVAVGKKVMQLLVEQRHALIAVLVRDAGYRLSDADAELGAAIALCQTLVMEMSEPVWGDGLSMQTGGLAVVNASAHRPLLDAMEGILSAHVLGYGVIYKPANTTRRVAELVMHLLRDAGLRIKGTKLDLILAQCMDNQVTERLFTHKAIAALFCYNPLSLMDKPLEIGEHVSLYRTKPSLHTLYLRAEANWRQAIDDLVLSYLRRSAQGKLCPEVLLVDATLYDDAAFQSRLKDAFASLRLRDVAKQRGDISPLNSRLDQEAWKRMTTLAEGESWLLAPEQECPAQPLYQPAIRFGVSLESELLTESCTRALPPHLSVVRINHAEQAIAFQACVSQSGYASLYSEDAHFVQLWRSGMKARQLYINTPAPICLTERLGQGAQMQILDRQYSGDFLPLRARWEESGHPMRLGKTANLSFKPWDLIKPQMEGNAKMRLHAACESTNYWWEEYYGTQSRHELPDGCVLERRSLYTPLCLRIEESFSDSHAALLISAALRTGQQLEFSFGAPRPWAEEYLRDHQHEVIVEDMTQFQARFQSISEKKMLLRVPLADEQTRRLAAKWLIPLCDEAVMTQGRAELMLLCRDQWCLLREKPLTTA